MASLSWLRRSNLSHHLSDGGTIVAVRPRMVVWTISVEMHIESADDTLEHRELPTTHTAEGDNSCLHRTSFAHYAGDSTVRYLCLDHDQ